MSDNQTPNDFQKMEVALKAHLAIKNRYPALKSRKPRVQVDKPVFFKSSEEYEVYQKQRLEELFGVNEKWLDEHFEFTKEYEESQDRLLETIPLSYAWFLIGDHYIAKKPYKKGCFNLYISPVSTSEIELKHIIE